MKIVLTAFVAVALCACAGPSGKESAANQAAPALAADGAADGQQLAAPLDPIKCERIAPTGSRISSKVCKRQSEWDAIRRGGQQMGEEIQRRAVHNNDTRG